MTDIDVLGKRLVKESQDRRDQIRRRQERYEKRAAIASLVLPLGAKIIEDGLIQKAQDFFNSENVLNLKREHTKALREQTTLFSLRDTISQSGDSDYDYFYNQIEPTVSGGIDEITGVGQEGIHVKTGEKVNPEWQQTVAAETAKLARERTDSYQEALAASEKIIGGEQFDVMMASKIKGTTPQNLIEATGRRITTLFGGKSTKERQDIALNDIRNHYSLTDARSLATFNDKFSETRNIRTAVNFTTLADSISTYTPKVIRSRPETILIRRSNGATVEVLKSIEVLDNGEDGETTIRVVGEVEGLEAELTLDDHQRQVNAASVRFDLFDNGMALLGENYQGWADQLEITRKDAEGNDIEGDLILPNDVRTLAEYRDVLANFNDYIENNPELVTSEEQRALQAVAVDAWVNSKDFLDKRDALGRVEYWDKKDTEEYMQAKRYYIDIQDDGRTNLTRPDNYDDLVPVLEAEFDFFDTYKALHSGKPASVEVLNVVGSGDQASVQPIVTPQRRESALERLVVQPKPVQVVARTGEPDWPDKYKKLQEGLVASLEIAERQGKDSTPTSRNIQTQMDNYEEDLRNKVSGYTNRIAIGGDVGGMTEQENIDELEKLEEELEQFLAMQDSDSTTSFDTFAGSGA